MDHDLMIEMNDEKDMDDATTCLRVQIISAPS